MSSTQSDTAQPLRTKALILMELAVFDRNKTRLLHAVESSENSDWSVNSFIMIVCKNIFNRGLDRKFWLDFYTIYFYYGQAF